MLLAESPPLSALDLLLAYDKDPDGEGPRLKHLCPKHIPDTSALTHPPPPCVCVCVLQALAATGSSHARSGWS